jgi:hypothetical protein
MDTPRVTGARIPYEVPRLTEEQMIALGAAQRGSFLRARDQGDETPEMLPEKPLPEHITQG